MGEDRKRILEMLEQGKITADEAAKLLDAIGLPETAETPRSTRRFLRVLITKPGKESAEVDVRVPWQLLRSGMKLASLVPPQAQIKINEAMGDKGFSLDLAGADPKALEEMVDSLGELSVNVNDDKSGEHVRVFCE